MHLRQIHHKHSLFPKVLLASLVSAMWQCFSHVTVVQWSLHTLQEWFHFVDKEKQVRIRIDGKVNQMMAEAAELKQWTISEVCCCLEHMS